MEYLAVIIIGILVIIIFVLIVKICFLHKAAREITQRFQEIITTDTNTLIDVSTKDCCMRKLAADINDLLRIVRAERQRYQQGDLELKEAVTNISHDLRTPLTAISGYLDLMEREERNKNVQRYTAHIQNRTNALKSLTEELFRYSLVVAAPELNMECIDVVRVLEENLLSFYVTMQEKGINPEIELPDQPVFRNLDAGALNRIFSNILGNALKYSDGELSVRMEESGRITFSNTAKNLDTVSVGRMFERFYTVEANCNSTGLGLSIAKLLTERMGGSISARYEDKMLSIIIMF